MTHRLSLHARFAAVLFGMLAPGVPAFASQADLDAEVQALLTDYQTKAQPIGEIVARVKWSGITDPRLFDAMEAEVLSRDSTDSSHSGVEYLAWLVHCLAYSGSSKYQPTIEAVRKSATTFKIKRHSETALQVLPQFARWNPIIAQGIDAVDAADISRQRTINMLQSNEPELMRAGASTVISSYLQDQRLTDLVRDLLLARYKTADNDILLAEPMSWFCKVLGNSGRTEYIAALQQVSASSQQSAIEKWAEKSLDKLQDN